MADVDKKEVIKHSAAIQISNVVNLLQRRAWNVLLANAFDELDKKDEFEITIRKLCSILKYDSRNDKHLKQLLRDLIDIKVEWNVLHKDEVEWGIAVLLAQAQIINGMLIYGYAPILRKRLHNPAMYAKISLSLQNKFDSKHSLALYELFLDYYNFKMQHGSTSIISIEDFRKLLGLKNDEYKIFGDLNKWVIKKAIKEINEKSDLFVDVEYKREKRKIVALRFIISKNPNNVLDINSYISRDGTEQKLLPFPEMQIDNKELLNTLTDEFGISNNKAIEILLNMDEFYIYDVLDVVREHIKTDKIRDISAFTIKALEKDYRRKKSKFETEKKIIEEKKNIEEEKKKTIKDMHNQFQKNWKQKIEEIIFNMNTDETDALIMEFKNKMIVSNPILKKEYYEKGLDSLFVRANYYDFVANKHLSEEDRDFSLYAKNRGFEIAEDKSD